MAIGGCSLLSHGFVLEHGRSQAARFGNSRARGRAGVHRDNGARRNQSHRRAKTSGGLVLGHRLAATPPAKSAVCRFEMLESNARRGFGSPLKPCHDDYSHHGSFGTTPRLWRAPRSVVEPGSGRLPTCCQALSSARTAISAIRRSSKTMCISATE